MDESKRAHLDCRSGDRGLGPQGVHSHARIAEFSCHAQNTETHSVLGDTVAGVRGEPVLREIQRLREVDKEGQVAGYDGRNNSQQKKQKIMKIKRQTKAFVETIERTHWRYVEDMRVLYPEQMGQASFADEESPTSVHLPHEVQFFVAGFRGTGETDGAGVVNADVDPAKLLGNLFDRPLDL